jgi:hypothetical protein
MREVIRVNETVKELPGGIDLHGRRRTSCDELSLVSWGGDFTLADQTIESAGPMSPLGHKSGVPTGSEIVCL